MIKFKDLIHLTFITILLLTNFLFTTINNEVLVFICTLVIFSSLFLIIKNRLGGYLNITILFLSFWGLYIFIGPFAALWGDGGILFTNYNGPFIVSDYLFYSSLGVVGFSIPFLIHNHPQKLNEPVINFGKILNNTYHLKILMNFGLFIAFLGLIMDTINIYRIGLSNILGIGKAALQSEINNLRFALPSEEFIFISFAIFAISLGVAIKNKFDIKKIFGIRVFILFVITSPILIGWLIYGRRGLLLTVILISIIGIYRFVQTRKLNKKIVIYILIFYILFAFITANRWVINESIKQKDFQLFLESALNIERTIERLALTNNEFVVGLGNFDLFYKGNEEKRYGKTYIDGLLSPIPRFLYPGEKPPGITYEYRDKYFPELAEVSSTASLGFSFMYEAYLNFGVIGIFVVYLVTGILFRYIENKSRFSKSLFLNVFYLLIISKILTFQRTGFFSIYTNLLYLLAYTFATFILFELFINRHWKKNKRKLQIS